MIYPASWQLELFHASLIYRMAGSLFDIAQPLVRPRPEWVPGSTILVPRGTRHGFTTDLDARALLITVPAGLQGFLEELGDGLAAGRSSQEIRKTLAGKYESMPTD